MECGEGKERSNGMTPFDWFLLLMVFKNWMHADIPSWFLWMMGGLVALTELLKLHHWFLKRQLDKIKKEADHARF